MSPQREKWAIRSIIADVVIGIVLFGAITVFDVVWYNMGDEAPQWCLMINAGIVLFACIIYFGTRYLD